MVISNDCDDRAPKHIVIVKVLPNGSPSLSAIQDSCVEVCLVSKEDNINACHDILLSNHKYNHQKINDIFTECLCIHVEGTQHKPQRLKHCSVSFEKNLHMLDA